MYEGQLTEMTPVLELEEGDEVIIRDALQLYTKPREKKKGGAQRPDIVSTPPRSCATVAEVNDEGGCFWVKLILDAEDAKRMGGKSKMEGWATSWQLGAAGCFDRLVNVKASS